LIHYMVGWDAAIKEMTRKLAYNGFATISPNMHSREGKATSQENSASIRAAGGMPDDRSMGDVRAAMQYLVERYDPDRAGWAPLPQEAYDHPHAPWWTQPDSSAARSAESWGNPSAEILGYLFEHSSCVADSLLTEVSQTALRMLEQASSPIGTYAILCYLRCTAFAPEDWRGPVLERLRADAAQAFDPDPSTWGVDLQPFWLVPNPRPGSAESALADVLSVLVRASLDREIDRQSDDGSWPPRWSWGTGDAAWKIAEREWAGEQTLRTLEALHHHGRIPEF